MANLGIKIYEKEFPKQIKERDISFHGSPIMEKYLGTNKEDELIENQINTKFSSDYFKGMANERFGHDGIFNYFWQVSHKFFEENYSTQYQIKKLGNLNDLDKFADLEIFLLEQGFQKITE